MPADSYLLESIQQLRGEGLDDEIILEHLSKQGYPEWQVKAALSELDLPEEPEEEVTYPQEEYAEDYSEEPVQPETSPTDIYREKAEEIIESMIDEKWDDLIKEVRNIVDFKEKVEARQQKNVQELNELQNKFTVMEQKINAELSDHEVRMRQFLKLLRGVKAVCSDVIPEVIEDVQEIKAYYFPKRVIKPRVFPKRRKKLEEREQEAEHALTLIYGAWERIQEHEVSRHYH